MVVKLDARPASVVSVDDVTPLEGPLARTPGLVVPDAPGHGQAPLAPIPLEDAFLSTVGQRATQTHTSVRTSAAPAVREYQGQLRTAIKEARDYSLLAKLLRRHPELQVRFRLVELEDGGGKIELTILRDGERCSQSQSWTSVDTDAGERRVLQHIAATAVYTAVRTAEQVLAIE